MQVEITLREDGPPMWFLGSDPKNPIVHFTFKNSGPEILEFESLSKIEQEHLLLGIKNKQIDSSVPFMELYKFFREALAAATPKPTAEVEKYLEAKATADQKVSMMNQVAKTENRLEKTRDRAIYLLKGNIRTIKSALSEEKELKVLTIFRNLEREGKKRAGVLNWLGERIDREQRKIVKNINKETANQNKNQAAFDKTQPATMGYNVVESEEEIVQFATGVPVTD